MSNEPRSKEQDLGEILLAANLVEADTLAAVQRECRRTGRPLWRLLTHDGLVSEDALFRTLRQEVRAPVLAEDQLKSVVVPSELRSALPQDVSQRLGILPLERSTDGRRAALAMVDPTADITPIWPALNKVGVTEVRRFLVHLGTLRLGLEVFYGIPWQDEQVHAAEADMIRTMQPETTQPLNRPRVPVDGSVMVDPQLQAEIDDFRPGPSLSAVTPITNPDRGGLFDGSQPSAISASGEFSHLIAPMIAALAPMPSGPVAISVPVALPISAPGMVTPPPAVVVPAVVAPPAAQLIGVLPAAQPIATPPAAQPIAAPALVVHPPEMRPAVPPPKRRRPREISLPELPASEVFMMEEPPNFNSSSLMLEQGPVQDALMQTAEIMMAALEVELRVTRPGAMARLAQGVAERLGWAQRAVRELMLVTRLYGLLRVQLLRHGALPPASPDTLGFKVKHPMMEALRLLEASLVDFMRLPTEPDNVPMGARLVEAVNLTMDLIDAGIQGEELAERLRRGIGDSQIENALAQIVETDLAALSIEPSSPPRLIVEPAAPSEPVVAAVSAQLELLPRAREISIPEPSPTAVEEPAAKSSEVAAVEVRTVTNKSNAPSAPRDAVPRPPLMPDVGWHSVLVMPRAS